MQDTDWQKDGPTAITLFSGCGGCSLGLLNAGFKVIFAADINSNVCQTYKANISDQILQCDLASIGIETILERTSKRQPRIDLVVAGPPCQGFSSAGGRDWEDPRNILLRHSIELIIELQPTWFILENVEGLLTANQGFFFVEAVCRLLEAGYWIKTKKVYMEEYGIPQRRKRLMVVGNLEEHTYDFPEITHTYSDDLSLFANRSVRTIMDAIGDLPEPSEDGNIVHSIGGQSDLQTGLRNGATDTTWHRRKSVNATIQSRIDRLYPGQTMRDLPLELQHESYARRAWRRVMDGTPTEKRGGAPSGLKKLLASEPSLTITSATSAEFVHPRVNRLLTLRECARIQTFPDTFHFCGSWSSVATQIGNAIPPMFMRLLAEHIKTQATWFRTRALQGRWLGISATKGMGFSPALNHTLNLLAERTNAWIG